MIPVNKLFRTFRNARLAIVLCSSLLVSCGDLTTAGIGGTGITSGEITGFGSIFVNGVEFNTDNSQFEVDGEVFATQFEAIQAGLAVGMVARIDGITDASGVTGTATLVVYDDEIEGPVINLTNVGVGQKSFEIFGQIVIIDEINTVFKDTSYDTLATTPDIDIVEVSGFHAPNNEIIATFVEWQELLIPGTSEVELTGTISNYNPTAMSFNLGSVIVDYTSVLPGEIEVPGGILYNGQEVEVEGIYQADGSILADEIEEEDDDFESELENISLQGIVSDFSNATGLLFTINGQPVDASIAELSPPGLVLGDGLNIEVKGSIVGGVLFADEVKDR